MNEFAQGFWILIVAACLVWYSTMTILVAFRGILDISGMLKRLRQNQFDDEKDSSNSP